MTDAPRALGPPPLQPPGSATLADWQRLDVRVGRIVAAEPFPEARRPAYRMTIDFGPGGTRRSSMDGRIPLVGVDEGASPGDPIG